MARKQRSVINLCVGWLLFICCSEALTQKSDTSRAPLDVILLIDNSLSTKATDPKGLRLASARFLIDYLDIYAQMKGINCCVGKASFGGTLGTVTHLQPVENGIVRKTIRAERLELTDFRPPLEWALREFKGHGIGTSNRKVALLFTDGRPELGKEALASEDKKRYFEGESFAPGKRDYNLKKIVGDLHTDGVVVFVVTIGDAAEDSTLWQRLLPPNCYHPIDATTDLNHLYHRLFADFFGLMHSELRTLRAGQLHREELPPYLNGVIFSFFKTKPDTRIALRDPAGNPHEPGSRAGREALQEIYVISEPDAGVWQAEVFGGGAQMYVDMELPRMVIEKPEDSLWVGHSATFNMSLRRSRSIIIDEQISLKAQVFSPAQQEKPQEQSLEYLSEGRYRLSLSDLEEPGRYDIVVSAFLKDKRLQIADSSYSFPVQSQSTSPWYSRVWEWIWVIILLIAVVYLYYRHKMKKGALNKNDKQYRHLAWFVNDLARLQRFKKLPYLRDKIERDEGRLREQLRNLIDDLNTRDFSRDPSLDNPVVKNEFGRLLDGVEKLEPEMWLNILELLAKQDRPEMQRAAFDAFDKRMSQPQKSDRVEQMAEATRRGLPWRFNKFWLGEKKNSKTHSGKRT